MDHTTLNLCGLAMGVCAAIIVIILDAKAEEAKKPKTLVRHVYDLLS